MAVQAFSEGDRTFERRSPIDGEVVSVASALTVRAAIDVADEAAGAFASWSQTGPTRRRELLLRAADLLHAHANAFETCMVAETGVSASWAGFNVRGGITALREAAALTTQIVGETIPSDQQGCVAMTFRVPAGVVLGIAPWNAPLLLGLRAIVTPLACGNTVVLKASELCPATHWMIGRLMADAGFPLGVVNVITHEPSVAPEMVEALIAHFAVRRVNFTGSTAVGRIVAGIAGRHLKPCLLELGGKSPMVILRDADVSRAVDAAAFGAFLNGGQICMSTERIVVEEEIADVFSRRLAATAKALGEASATRAEPLFDCLISSGAADRVDDLVKDAVKHGARLLTSMKRDGARVAPIVLDGVKRGMKVYEEESFGPVAAIVRVRDAREAVEVANDTEFGLSAAVFGGDVSTTMTVARQLNVGVCHVNGATVRSDAALPFGGTKASGYGRFGGRAAIAEFTELRSITIQTQRQHYEL